MFRFPFGVSRGPNALVLLDVRKAAVVELKAKCDVLLRIWVEGPLSSSSRYQKFAFDAVIGVLGVFEVIWADGVWALRSSASRSFSASIFVVIGVPSGKRFKGGSFNGCRPLRPSTVEVRVRDSGVFAVRTAE